MPTLDHTIKFVLGSSQKSSSCPNFQADWENLVVNCGDRKWMIKIFWSLIVVSKSLLPNLSFWLPQGLQQPNDIIFHCF